MYKLRIKNSNTRFSAVHFITLEDAPQNCKCEKIHGHNYNVELILNGTLNSHGYVVDFSELKMHLKNIVKEFNNSIIIATKNPLINIEIENNDQVLIYYNNTKSSFPKNNVVFLDEINTTAELLAKNICEKIHLLLKQRYNNINNIEISVEEIEGQSASYIINF